MNFLKKSLCSLIFLVSYQSQACSCDGFASFCESTNSESRVAIMYAIEKGDTLSDFGQGKYVKFVIVQNLQNAFASDTITAIGDLGGAMCDIPVSTLFNIGDTIISNGSFSSCSQGYLRVQNNQVIGHISRSLNDSMPLEKFVENINACSALSLSYGANIYPNPASDFLFVTVEDEFMSLHNIEIVDASGKVCLQILQTLEGKVEFSLADLTSGIYFVHAYNNDEKLLTEKLVVF